MIAWIVLSWFSLAFFGGLLVGAFFHAGKGPRAICTASWPSTASTSVLFATNPPVH